MQEIYLPVPSWKGIEKNPEFEVTISNPNNMQDEYLQNNKGHSLIALPYVMPDKFVIHIESNDLNRAAENSYTVTDGNGKIIYRRDTFQDNAVYYDTVSFESGCYTFLLSDKKEDGMMKHWWYAYYNKPELVGKNGRIEFITLENKVLREFPYDFGQELRFCFRVGNFY
jgi:hypothetical protein